MNKAEQRTSLAALSLDVDNQWSYMKTHGDTGWTEYPSYYPVLIPMVLDILDDLGLSLTFFVVGKDAEIDINKPYIREMVQRGHEVGNHSYAHEPWLHLYDPAELENDIRTTHEFLTELCGSQPIGFRGPGFSWSRELLDVLIRYGYRYDGSTLPTFIGPLARAYYFKTSHFSREEREKRSALFGKFSEGFRKLKPYRISGNSDGSLLEIPVTTMPLFRTPFHLSYLHYLAGISRKLMRAYLDTALGLCAVTGTPVSFLLHPLDLLSGENVPDLKFFPGMNLPASYKREIFIEVLEILMGRFAVKPMGVFAHEIDVT